MHILALATMRNIYLLKLRMNGPSDQSCASLWSDSQFRFAAHNESLVFWLAVNCQVSVHVKF